MYPRLPFLLLPYSRAEMPGWSKLLTVTRAIVGIDDTSWKDAPRRTIRGKQHGYLMRLDLSDWAERMTFFLGRYYELGTLRVLDSTLRPGDHFVDIGANTGMLVLHARSLVGRSGRIDCFEPNPECVTAIREHIKMNAIENVELHACALSDSPGQLSLSLTSAHSGTGTLAEVPDGEVERTITVKVCIADELLSGTGAVDVIKIDVEGFEMHVLSGLKHTLTAFKPIVITELLESQLQRAGSSIVEVSEFLRGLGYVPFGIGSVRRGFHHDLALFRDLEGCKDAVWTHPENHRSAGVLKFVR